jgi:hypothetical protein
MINGFRVQKRFEIRPNLTIAGYINAQAEKPREAPAAGI